MLKKYFLFLVLLTIHGIIQAQTQQGVKWSVNPDNTTNVAAPIRKPGRNGDVPGLPVRYVNISQYAVNAVNKPTTGPNGYLLLFIFDVTIGGKFCVHEFNGVNRRGIWAVAKILDPGEPVLPGDIGRSFSIADDSPGAAVVGFFWNNINTLIPAYPTHADAVNSLKKP